MVAVKSVKAGQAFVSLVLRDFVSAGLKKLQAKLRAFAAAAASTGMALAAVGSMIAAPLAIASLAFSKMGDRLQKFSARVGVSVEELSRMSHAIQISGGTVDDLEKGFKGLARFVTDAGAGLSTQARALGVLGLKFEDLKNLSPEDQFKLIADQISKIEDPTLATGTALTIFGRAGMKMMPMLKSGAKGIKALGDEADAMGHTMSTDDANAAAVLTDEMTKMWNTVKMAVFHIGAGLAPALTKATTRIREMSVIAMGWIKTHRSWITLAAKVALGLFALSAVMFMLGPLFGALAAAVGVLITALSILQGVLAFVLSPMGIILGILVAITAAMGGFANFSQTAAGVVGDAWSGMKSAATTAFGGVTDALLSGEWKLAAQIAWLGIKAAWLSGIRPLREAWIGFKGWWRGMVIGMSSWFKKSWSKDMNQLKTGWTIMKGKIMGEDSKVTAARIQQDSRKAKAYQDSVDKNAAADRDANNAKVAGELKAIDASEKAAHARLKAMRDVAAKKRADKELADDEAAKNLVPPEPPEIPGLDELGVAGWDGMASAAKKMSGVGAFSSAAVGRMGGGKDPVEKVVEETKRSNEILEQIQEETRMFNAVRRMEFA